SFLLLSFSIILPYLIVDLKLCNRTHTTGIQDFTKNFFSPRNRCLKRSYKGIYKTFKLFIYLDNGQWTHGGCRSAPMFFRSKNSHVFSPPAPTKFPNNKTVGVAHTHKRNAFDHASEK
ncbi:hypothetical protein ACQUFJ_12415, partial [Lactococcus lactis]|uniref:hypothetical protein n=1 Tax=Lactococcus lactis TaxID=1358 RepID=UPI003D142396